MASTVPDFEYDIFISYRHNDNRSGWVTEFVNALQVELAATIKEPVSVYFDTHPHDGLLESHNVEKSLEGKLKCLVFIPIISQTYCDPNAFAWKHEFCAFNKLATGDKLGRDIKLSNGNVASRILPITIHDLDHEDKIAVENEIGVLRAIEFIFSASGVNRPLVPSDQSDKNLNKSHYRDQINKVANAVKQIISAIRNPTQGNQPQRYFQKIGKSERNQAVKKYNIALISSILLLLLVVIVSFYFSVTKSARDFPSKSIAVLPFENLTNDPELETFCDGVNEEILNHLSKLGSLSVTSRTSVKMFKGTKLSAIEIAKKLGVNHILEGSVRKSGKKIRITVQLIEATSDKHLWSEDYDYSELKDIFPVQTDVSTKVTEVLKLKLTPKEKKSFSKKYTENIQAYKLYRRGRNFWDKRSKVSYDSAKVCFTRATEIDPDYALAYVGLANCFLGLAGTDLQLHVAKDYALKALSLDSTLSEAWTTVGFIRTHLEYDWQGGKPMLEKAIQLNPNNPLSHLFYGNVFIFFYRDKVKGLREVKKALELDPLSPSTNWAVGARYMGFREYDRAIKQFHRELVLDPNNNQAMVSLGFCFLQKKLYEQAKEVFNKVTTDERRVLLCLAHSKEGDLAMVRKELEEILKIDRVSNSSNLWLAEVYVTLGDMDKAMVLLQRLYDDRNLGLLGLNVDPTFDPIRNDTRFKAILKKMNLN